MQTVEVRGRGFVIKPPLPKNNFQKKTCRKECDEIFFTPLKFCPQSMNPSIMFLKNLSSPLDSQPVF
jgi:hypothetical protein